MAERIDVIITLKTGFPRGYAQQVIKSGGVKVNGAAVTKPGAKVSLLSAIDIDAEPPKYAGRGGLKLEAAIREFGIDISGKDCLDIGASTGGFTDCLIQSGALSVTAVDVGTGQLAPKLKGDDRVVSLENTDIRDYRADKRFGFVCADLSFISLTKVINVIAGLTAEGGGAVLLIKPQFEAGRGNVGKRGVVLSEAARKKAVKAVTAAAAAEGFSLKSVIESPIKGGDGNIEYLAYFTKRG